MTFVARYIQQGGDGRGDLHRKGTDFGTERNLTFNISLLSRQYVVFRS